MKSQKESLLPLITTELHRQMYEKWETPSISEIKKDKVIKLTGSTPLDHTGKYAFSLDMQETRFIAHPAAKCKKNR